MSDQFMRQVEVTIEGKAGALVINGPDVALTEQLKVDFSGKLTIGSSQNTGTVTIWNLTRSNRAKLGEEFDQLTLKVKYEKGESGILIKGSIRDVTNKLDGADVSSEIEIGDGDEAVNKSGVSKSFPAGTKPKEVASYIVGQMAKVTPGPMVGIDDLPAYTKPIAVFGYAKRELDTLGREHGFYWSIQSGTAEIVKADRFIDDVTILSKATGLLNTPEETDKGIKVRCLINPRIKPNRVIDVRSDFQDEGSGRDKTKSDQGGGLFRVATIDFSGSNRAQEFYFDIEANRIQGNKVVK
ncbi:hypothetical protein FHT98_0615 [Bosea sp. AK1]|uniref:baseplate hub protein n=1 Tax=Bosea sp. AK1 TaxID=2587160 RepID=UPI00114F6CE6|nr:hypothetical protein [Bosea sp. AK1]TQI72895.1 hypothetical protein FHT98_0615 [Bosea sp. AK1]